MCWLSTITPGCASLNIPRRGSHSTQVCALPLLLPPATLSSTSVTQMKLPPRLGQACWRYHIGRPHWSPLTPPPPMYHGHLHLLAPHWTWLSHLDQDAGSCARGAELSFPRASLPAHTFLPSPRDWSCADLSPGHPNLAMQMTESISRMQEKGGQWGDCLRSPKGFMSTSCFAWHSFCHSEMDCSCLLASGLTRS